MVTDEDMLASGAGEFVERRQAARIATAIPVEIQGGRGTTRDVSTSGVFFETDLSLLPGEPITVYLILEHVSPAAPLRVRCEGRIVRVERRDGRRGVAVAASSYRLDLAGPQRPVH